MLILSYFLGCIKVDTVKLNYYKALPASCTKLFPIALVVMYELSFLAVLKGAPASDLCGIYPDFCSLGIFLACWHRERKEESGACSW